jgi:hypothetical protein
MRVSTASALPVSLLGSLLALTVPSIVPLRSAHADVTVQQKLTLNVGGAFDIDTTTTEYTSLDRQRRDSQVHCGGFMSMFCGKANSDEITRLDRGVQWHLTPAKKTYLETTLPTAADRAAARAHMQEIMAKLQQCQAQQPQPQAQPAVDKSKCDMSPPTVTVKDDGPHASILGHDTQAHSVIIGQTCTNRETGDICEFRYGFDVWLTPDQVQGLSEQRDYQRAYLKRMGLDESDEVMQGQVRRFMAAYADTLKDLAGKAQGFKGTPLRTRFAFSIGGEHCGQVQKAKTQSASASSPDSTGGSSGPSMPPTSINGAAAAVGAKLFGSMFKKKSAPAASGDAPAGTAADGAAAPPGPPMLTVASFTLETTSVQPGPIAPDQFEIPAGWTRQTPPPAKPHDKALNCGPDAQPE